MITNILLTLSNIPALLKGAKIGKNSFLSPGYDIYGVYLSKLNILSVESRKINKMGIQIILYFILNLFNCLYFLIYEINLIF